MKIIYKYLITVSIIFSIFLMLFIFNVNLDNFNQNIVNVYEDNNDILIVNNDNDYAVTSANYDDTSSFKNTYFSRLTQNFGKNEFGSCGYVALGMLLTYMDSYYNDYIVPEQFDKNENLISLDVTQYSESPGSREEKLNISSENEYYNSMIREKYNNSLHAYLLKIGNELGYGMGTTIDKIYNILIDYLNKNQNLDENDLYISKFSNYENPNDIVSGTTYTYSEKFRNEIIFLVKTGYPVYVSIGSSGQGEGHAVIAYDYDENTDTLFAHFGADGIIHYDLYTNSLNVQFDHIRGYLVIQPKIYDNHVHSNNYILNDIGVCACQLSNHEHKFNYITHNDSYHKEYCHCGYEAIKGHRFSVIGKNYVCNDCLHIKPYDGKFFPVPFTPNNIINDLYELGIIPEGVEL